MSTSQDKRYGIVCIHTGVILWTICFKTLGAAKLAVRNNNFNAWAVGVAELNDKNEAIHEPVVYNYETKKWEELLCY
jgi:hypothetical protein